MGNQEEQRKKRESHSGKPRGAEKEVGKTNTGKMKRKERSRWKKKSQGKCKRALNRTKKDPRENCVAPQEEPLQTGTPLGLPIFKTLLA